MNDRPLSHLLADPLLELPSKAARLGWLIGCAERMHMTFDVFLDDEELLRDLIRRRIRELQFHDAVVRRRDGLDAAAVWMGRPNATLDGQRPSELLDHERDEVMDAAWDERDDPSDEQEASDAPRDPDTGSGDDTATGAPS